MKLIKIYLTASFIFSTFLINAQKEGKDDKSKMYYKDTLFNFVGFKVEVVKSIATDKYIKSDIIITNTSNDFIKVEPEDIFGYVYSEKDKQNPVLKKAVIIPPKYSKVVGVKFMGNNFRQPTFEIDVNRLQTTDKVIKEYDIPDFDIFSKDSIVMGSLKWKVIDMNSNNERAKESKKDYRLVARLTYTGNNFLGISFNNIELKTKDGGSYINVIKKTGFLVTTDKFFYDNTKKFEKQVLGFTVESGKIIPENQPKICLKGVFKEYSFQKIEGFKIHLRQGTIEDYKGGEKKTKEIEGMEE